MTTTDRKKKKSRNKAGGDLARRDYGKWYNYAYAHVCYL
jgi:hypothetical protein